MYRLYNVYLTYVPTPITMYDLINIYVYNMFDYIIQTNMIIKFELSYYYVHLLHVYNTYTSCVLTSVYNGINHSQCVYMFLHRTNLFFMYCLMGMIIHTSEGKVNNVFSLPTSDKQLFAKRKYA